MRFRSSNASLRSLTESAAKLAPRASASRENHRSDSSHYGCQQRRSLRAYPCWKLKMCRSRVAYAVVGRRDRTSDGNRSRREAADLTSSLSSRFGVKMASCNPLGAASAMVSTGRSRASDGRTDSMGNVIRELGHIAVTIPDLTSVLPRSACYMTKAPECALKMSSPDVLGPLLASSSRQQPVDASQTGALLIVVEAEGQSDG